MPRWHQTYEDIAAAEEERRQRAATDIQRVARARAAARLRAKDEFLEEVRSHLKDTIHADLIPPKGEAGRRDWKSRKARRSVRRVLLVHFVQLVLTWVLFGVSISHHSLERKNSKACTAVLTDLAGEPSIAATCTEAVLVNESRIELRDPFYEAALNLTERFPDAFLFLPREVGDKVLTEYYRLSPLLSVMELFLIMQLSRKVAIVPLLIICGFQDPNKKRWGIVWCGFMLFCFMVHQVAANLMICVNSWRSGASLFNTIFATFTLTLVADLDDKVGRLGVLTSWRFDRVRVVYRHRPRRTPAGRWFALLALLRTPANGYLALDESESQAKWVSERGKRFALDLIHAVLLNLVICLVALVFFLPAIACQYFSAAIYIAMNNDPVLSLFTLDALSSGTDYRDAL